jgi:hypothetical protein
VNKIQALYNCANWDETFAVCRNLAGFDWINKRENPWDWCDVESSELEMRSAMEFLRPELSPQQLAILEEWDARYRGWRDEGIFFKRYRDAQGARFTWCDERGYAEALFGLTIPPSHWWYWPPGEGEKQL